jgi:mRNA-degrading endonuclease toxin of MazEF toxin-antitoxin module
MGSMVTKRVPYGEIVILRTTRPRLAGVGPQSYNQTMSSTEYTTDTSPEAMAVQLECMRLLTPQQRVRRSCALSRQVRTMAFAAIRRRHPHLSDRDVQLAFIGLAYGEGLANDVRLWQREQGN